MTKRKRHTLSEKVSIAKKALLPFNTIAAIAREEELPESTVCGWVKGIKGLESLIAEQEHSGMLKHVRSDKMPMLAKGLQSFCNHACGLIPPIPLTLETISVKANEISKLLLAQKKKQ